MNEETISPTERNIKDLVYVSHLDSKSKIPLVEYNLKQLRPFFEKIIIVYSSINSKNIFLKNGFCGLNEEEINLIPNKGYDFGKYKFGLEKINSSGDHHTAIINDSVSVIKSLNDIFSRINFLINQGFDYIGFLGSEEIKSHYQSWFWVLNNKAVDYFIKNVNIDLKTKRQIIRHNEVGISNQMISNFKSCSLFNHATNIFYRQPNVILRYISDGFPFIKNNIFDHRFLKRGKNLKFNESLKEPKYVNETIYNLIKNYYQ